MEGIANQIVTDITTPKTEDVNPQVNQATGGGDDDFAKRLAILARKEKGFMEEKKTWEQKLKEADEKTSKLSKWQEFEDLNDDNTVDFLQKKGLSLEKLQEKWLSRLDDSDLDPVQKQLKELRQALSQKDEDMKKIVSEQFAEREKKDSERKLEEQTKIYSQKLESFLEENKDKYDLIGTFGAKDEVFKVIKDVYMKTSEEGTPRLLTFDEACELYEKRLDDVVIGLRKSNKVRRLLGMEADEVGIANLLGQKTIDDTFSQSSATNPEFKTERERELAAAKLLEGMFKGM